MSRYQPTFHETEACKRRLFDRSACIAECLECGDTMEQAERRAEILARAHELKENERIISATGRVDYIKTHGRNPLPRYFS